ATMKSPEQGSPSAKSNSPCWKCFLLMRVASDSSSFGVRFAKRGVFRSIASTPRFIVVFARGYFATAHRFGLRKFYGALKTTSKGRGAAVDRHCLERDAARENQPVIIGVIF